MTPKELKAHKEAPKSLREVPEFKSQKRNKLPKPLKGIGGPRVYCSGMLQVSSDHEICMFWKDGQILSDRAFYGYLFCKLADGSLSPLFEFHWHPSHKRVHCKVPCKTDLNYTNRTLPRAPELSINTKKNFDPRNEVDLIELMTLFCDSCGVSLPLKDPKTKTLWQ